MSAMDLCLTESKSSVPGFDPSFKVVSRSDLLLGLNMDAARRNQLMNVAKAPGKQLFMTGFMLWMSGSSMNIFSIMMTGMALWTPLKTLLSMNQTFEKFNDLPNGAIMQAKVIFLFLNGIGLAMGVYKLGNMGLLPLYSSDWISMLEVKSPIEISHGASLFSL
uniref:ER membrane protein complex subunit 4 n=1 Tax=Aplanochytrium stocchinoi TaxID=215587 RepID=A0A7S3LQY2_9STRA|mmetsp:Transcript_1076/g.1373  ORF Transcript_1076/g.1373 Transcript_1076/m.1373 type:complete len:163 (+) Transcript_1076:233-721(+)|eukprot:CAMPEP_0204830220 /NCGR_PEP_ID=MMETSP1346-20131115/8405_1 /ASSEMBLY_ACC=CAM_ASM_000771 /TAXON_ID=215587 /ORGANISM="Aplanochytrium stocchinoi, Strain GSBS06" /LENGTH=162 /DNA_ID=CAMNT_0051960375 /DNA_START=121 /DNA_END=609 /DNA_ORIENTATION=+